MKLFIATTLISIAAVMMVRPLPRLQWVSQMRIPRLSQKQKVKRNLSFEEELQFVFNLRSQLNAGINQLDTLRFAVSRAPEFAFKKTRQALTSQTNAYSALHDDSKVYKVASLASCANLLELSSQSGSSINEALTHVADKLMMRRNQEQLIATELASTKATVFVLAFAEGGNTWNNFKQFSPFNVRRSAGFGARIFLPIFGLRGLYYGYGFDSIPGISAANKGQFHFSIAQQMGGGF